MTAMPPTTSVLGEVITWPGIDTQPTPRGATAIVLDGQELGHVHPDRRTVDMPLSPDRREQVLAAKRAKPWFSNYVSKPLKTDADAQDAIALLRESYDELPPTSTKHPDPKEHPNDPHHDRRQGRLRAFSPSKAFRFASSPDTRNTMVLYHNVKLR